MSAANAIVVGRWVRRVSRPSGLGRSRTTVAAGNGSTTPWPVAAFASGSPAGADVSAIDRRVELLPERRRIRHRQPADELTADIRCRATTNRDAVGEQRHHARARVRCHRDHLVRPEPAPDLGEQAPGRRVVERPDDRDFDSRREREVHRGQPLRKPGRVPADELDDGPKRPLRSIEIPTLAGPGGQTKEDACRHRVPRGNGVVLDVLGPGDEAFVVVGCVEEPAGGIGEPSQHAVHQVSGHREPALLEGRLVERKQAVGEVRVVLEDALTDRPTVLP